MFRYEPPTAERTIGVARAPSNDRRSGSTLDHLNRGGLPANPKILGELKRKLKAGAYRDDRESLITDLKCDPALFIYSVKNLKRFVSNASSISPEDGIRELDESALVALFDVTEGDISIHRLRTMSPAQSLRLQHTIICSQSAEAMAERIDLPASDAYSAALFRQLGLNYVAWNYPEQYRRAMRAQKKGASSIEAEIEKILGLSTLDIAMRFAAQWGITNEIRQILRPTPNNVVGASSEHTKVGLLEVCELAELFACANDPENHPGAEDAWHAAEEKVKKVFGGDLAQTLTERIETSIERYESEELPHFKPALIPRKRTESEQPPRGKLLLQANPYVSRCAPQLAAKFESVYSLLENEPQASVPALRALVEQVIPAAGFGCGCFYLLDERNLMLKPALRVGEKALSAYQSFKLHQNNLITTSLDSAVPIMQQGISVDGGKKIQLCGGLGSIKPQGVLYLELQSEYFESTDRDPILYFHAVRISLMDVLNIVYRR
ncbi:MAG: HDOD domain-containing protein [Deltaproteobacteria bacterium]|nr:HDOD domain-containing protein [Deltaproteobacteria bacterium]